MNMQEFLRAQLEEGRAIGAFPAAAAAIGLGTRVLAEAFVERKPVTGQEPADFMDIREFHTGPPFVPS